MEGYQWGGEGREWGRIGTGNKKHNLQVPNRQGEVKNSVGNVEAKELICITHGHELKGEGILMGDGVQGRGGERGEKWENCNSIINKMYF